MTNEHADSPGDGGEPSGGLLTGLSARLLVLTIVFVMLAELMIWTPSIAQFRKRYLEEMLVNAHLAMIAVRSLKPGDVGPELENELLSQTGTYGIVLNLPEQHMLMVGSDMPPPVDLVVRMDGATMLDWIVAAFSTLEQTKNRVLRVVGTSPKNPKIGIEVVMDEMPLRKAMLDYSQHIMGLSVVISLITATLVFFSLQWLMVRPVLRMGRLLAKFRENPEAADDADELRIRRTDEIGVAYREFANMQMQIRAALRQKTRLATLGEAVAKINHDLRNTLATAVLAFDRLTEVDDPEVKRLSPRLYKALTRATDLCSQTLEYVGASDLVIRREPFHLSELIAEVAADVRETVADAPPILNDDGSPVEPPPFRIDNRVPFEVTVNGDRVQLFRALLNLVNNARQAGAECLTVAARVDEQGRAMISLIDDGPGLLDEIAGKVFQPFTSAKAGGTGLGLVIVRDIIGAHRGEIRVAHTSDDGVTFEIMLPGASFERMNEELL